MSDITTPEYETNEAIQDTDLAEMYQPASGGIRREKKVLFSVLRTFFQGLLPGRVTQNETDISTLDGEAVKTAGVQAIADVKTFSSSPIVPAPTTDLQASTKKYVDDLITGLILKYATAWVPISDWTNAQFNIPHNLGTELSDLVVKFYISTDGTEANSFEPINGSYSSAGVLTYGHTYHAININSFEIQTGINGILYLIQGSGAGGVVAAQSYYYKVKVYKI